MPSDNAVRSASPSSRAYGHTERHLDRNDRNEASTLSDETTQRETRHPNLTTDYGSLFRFDYDDQSHGWYGDSANIGAASLFYRTAKYVPMQDWTDRTGEKL